MSELELLARFQPSVPTKELAWDPIDTNIAALPKMLIIRDDILYIEGLTEAKNRPPLPLTFDLET